MSKNILLIGASGGIGKNTTQRLLDEGHHLWIASRYSDETFDHDNINFIEHDILSSPLPPEFFPDALHGMVYFPGTINLKPFRALKEEDFLSDYKINAIGAAQAIQSALKPLKQSGNASVVLYSTVAVGQGMPFHASIAMAKGAVEGLTKSLAAELAPNIRVNAIAPSLTDTPLAENLLNNEARKKSANERHPLKRYGKPEDIAAATVFLLSDGARWMSGQILGVDGGLSTLRA